MHALDRRPGVSDHAFGSVGQSHGGNRMEYRNAPVEAPLLVVAEKVVALGRLTGAVLWEFKPGDQIRKFVIEDGLAYLLDRTGVIHCVSLLTGALQGTVKTGLDGAEAMLYDGETLLCEQQLQRSRGGSHGHDSLDRMGAELQQLGAWRAGPSGEHRATGSLQRLRLHRAHTRSEDHQRHLHARGRMRTVPAHGLSGSAPGLPQLQSASTTSLTQPSSLCRSVLITPRRLVSSPSFAFCAAGEMCFTKQLTCPPPGLPNTDLVRCAQPALPK